MRGGGGLAPFRLSAHGLQPRAQVGPGRRIVRGKRCIASVPGGIARAGLPAAVHAGHAQPPRSDAPLPAAAGRARRQRGAGGDRRRRRPDRADRRGPPRGGHTRRLSRRAAARCPPLLASSTHRDDAARFGDHAPGRLGRADRREDAAVRAGRAGRWRDRTHAGLLSGDAPGKRMGIDVKLPQRVRLVEVGPRDGLQNEKADVPTDVSVGLIDRLTAAGFPAIEAASFVSPKWVPQMADAAQVMARIRREDGVRYPVLTPNLKGFEAALAARADEVAVFVAASETFSRRNINCSIAQSLERARPIFSAAKANGVRVRGYVSCVLGCPYEGEVDRQAVADVAAALWHAGAYEVSLGDTIGVGTAGKTQALISAVAAGVPVACVAGHFHDTYGQALTNVYAAMELGVATFDCSVAGLGGCPYAKGATGNVASEDLVYLLAGLGIETGVDLTRLRIAGQFISDFLGRPTASRVARALAAKEPAGATP